MGLITVASVCLFHVSVCKGDGAAGLCVILWL